MLSNLDNQELLEPDGVLDSQAHTLNYKRYRVVHETGIRSIILKRNSFTDVYAIELAEVLKDEKFLKHIDLSGNKIKEHGLEVLVKRGLLINQSVIALDARCNPGLTTKLRN